VGGINEFPAIKAALDTQTNLLLGLWASAGQDTINNEIAAIKQAVNNWGPQMKTRVVGISVGSEDLYRSSAQGQANNAGVGATSAQIVKYIKQLRTALKGTALEGVRVGHVDTWTAWELPENAAVVNNVDWLGHNSFPYFETTKTNPIGQGKNLFFEGLSHTEGAAKGKPVWITETGWPSKGPSMLPTLFMIFLCQLNTNQSYRERPSSCQHGQRPTILARSRLRLVRQAEYLVVYPL
jgi:glucan endo-1,3-beta-D-glucosidase